MMRKMNAFELSQIISERNQRNSPYLEFLRVPSLSAGLYVLPADTIDEQQPHSEDEVYYIVSGKGFIRVGTEDRAVQAGTMVFVSAHMEHRFHTIVEDLTILVFFAPAEYTQAHAKDSG